MNYIDKIKMGKTKIYMIITNDKFELPLKTDLVGAKSVSDYLGINVQSVRDHLHTGKWKGKYKVEVTGVVNDDQVQKQRERCKKYSMTHDRSEYFRKRYYETKK